MEQALFDKAAANYDDDFTNSIIGKLQRKRVYHWLDKINFFSKNKSVFELNCGTGFDAEYFYEKGLKVRATDISNQMIEVCKQSRSTHISFSQLDFKNLNSIELNENAIFSNFGGLNCLSSKELADVISTMANKQVAGNTVVMIIMPKFSVVESVYLFLKLKWRQMFRRNTNKAVYVHVEGVNIATYFHSPSTLKKSLKPNYHIKLVKPVALFLPPSYLEPFAKRHPKIMVFAEKLEQFFGRFSLFSGLSDHYIIVAERK